MAVPSSTSRPKLRIERSGTGTCCQCSRLRFCSPQMWMKNERHAQVDDALVDPLVVGQHEGLELLGGDELVGLGGGAVEGHEVLGAELAGIVLGHPDDEVRHLVEHVMHQVGLLEHPEHHAVLADDRPRPGERRADLHGHRHAVLGLAARQPEGDGQRARRRDVLGSLESEGVLLAVWTGCRATTGAPEYFL